MESMIYGEPNLICFINGEYVPIRFEDNFKKGLYVDDMRIGHYLEKTNTKINGLDLWEEIVTFENVPLCPALDLEFVQEFQQKTGINLYD
jgi:hypothetical protein